MRPDLVMRERGVPRLVADCKYKRLEPDAFRHHDLYQVLAYCTAMDVSNGLLAYPAHEVGVRDQVRIRHTPVSIRQTTIDLSGNQDALRLACDTFTREVLELAVAK